MSKVTESSTSSTGSNDTRSMNCEGSINNGDSTRSMNCGDSNNSDSGAGSEVNNSSISDKGAGGEVNNSSISDKGAGSRASDGLSNSKTQDSAAKLIFGNNRLCSQFLRDYSEIELLKDVKEEDIEDMTTRYIPMFTEERDSDVVKKVHLKNGEFAYMIALIEHKSAVDYNVTMQLLRYMVYIWEDYEKEQDRLHKGISKTRDFRYPPILPIVYYEWTDKWTSAIDFKERIFLNDVFEEFIPDYRYKLIKLESYSDDDLIGQNDEISFVMLIDRLKDNYEFHRLMSDLPEGYLDGISEMSTPDVLDIISRVVGAMLRRRNISEERIEDLTEGIRSRPMGQLFEHWDNGPDEELVEKGRKEGREEERKNTEAEKKRADAEKARADTEKTRADAAEARVRELEAQLADKT